MSFFSELKRRKVFRIGAAYAIVAWLLIQVADTLLPTFGVPEWVLPAFSSLIILGLPVALILAWAYEVTPDGIKTDSAAHVSQTVIQTTGTTDRTLIYLILVLVLLVAGFQVADRFTSDSTANAANNIQGTGTSEVTRLLHTLPEGVTLNQSNNLSLDVSADGSQILYAAAGGIYTRQLNELEGKLVTGTNGLFPTRPGFSADGENIIFIDIADFQIKRVAVNGGTPIPVIAGGRGVQFSLIENMIVTITGCEISQVSINGGISELLAEGESNFNCGFATKLPNSEVMIYSRSSTSAISSQAESEIFAHSLITGEKTGLFPGMQANYLESSGHLVYFNPALGQMMARTFDPETLAFGTEVALDYDISYNGVRPQYSLSASGTLAYFRGESSNSGRVLGIADRAGRIQALDVPVQDYRFLSVSPDGQRVAVQVSRGNNANIFIYDLSGNSEIRQLTSGGQNQQPAWSPDGQWITFASNRDGSSRIYRQLANGRGSAEVLTTPEEGYSHTHPEWHPDGRRLTYSQRSSTSEGSESTTWSIAIPEGTPELLVEGDNSNTEIAFSPNGNVFAYTSDQDSGPQVFIEPYPRDGSRVRVSEFGSAGIIPVWSIDGTYLTYQTLGGSHVAIDVTTPGLTLSNRRILPFTTGQGFRLIGSLPEDDQMIVAVPVNQTEGNNTDSALEIVIVRNWIEELKRLVPHSE
jgi:WD40 repeat protein